MKLKNSGAEIFIPDGLTVEEGIQRTTHMAISAHQDDIEIMAHDGIIKCFGREDQWFMGVVVTDGAGSPRNDLYASYSDREMRIVRKKEQKKAAYIGEYGGLGLLDYPSTAVKDPKNVEIIEDLKEIINAARPLYIYTHNLADKHDTHVGVALKVIQALREIPAEHRPEKLYGCEVWRNLDWMQDEEKVVFDVSAHPNLAAALLEVFDSQICGGKRYDLATIGRRFGNASFIESHATDVATALIYGMDMTPLMQNENLDIKNFVNCFIENFRKNVAEKIDKMQ